jgi:hypothetical protein
MRKLTRRELEIGLKEVPLSSILGESVSKSLTGKQKAFAMEVAKGQTKANAYRKAYKPDASPHTMASKPYELMRDDRIQREIKAYELAIEAAQHRTPAALRELVISGLVEIALNADTKDAVRVQALRTLGTVTEVAAFTERKQIQTISSSESAKASIMAHLQTLMAGDVVDVTTNDADSLLAELKAAPESDADADPPTGGSPAEGSGVPGL